MKQQQQERKSLSSHHLERFLTSPGNPPIQTPRGDCKIIDIKILSSPVARSTNMGSSLSKDSRAADQAKFTGIHVAPANQVAQPSVGSDSDLSPSHDEDAARYDDSNIDCEEGKAAGQKIINDSPQMTRLISLADSHINEVIKRTLPHNEEQTNSASDIVNYASFEEKSGATVHFLKHRPSEEEPETGCNPMTASPSVNAEAQGGVSREAAQVSESKSVTGTTYMLHEEGSPPLTPALEEESEVSARTSELEQSSAASKVRQNARPEATPVEKTRTEELPSLDEVVFHGGSRTLLQSSSAKKSLSPHKDLDRLAERRASAVRAKENAAARRIQRCYKRLVRRRTAARLKGLKQRIYANRIQRRYRRWIERKHRESEELLNKYTALCAVMIQKLYRGHKARKTYGPVVKRRLGLSRLRKALLIGWKIRRIQKCRKIVALKEVILGLTRDQCQKPSELTKTQRHKRVEDLIRMFQILYVTGQWIQSYPSHPREARSPAKKASENLFASVPNDTEDSGLAKQLELWDKMDSDFAGEVGGKKSVLEPIRETLKEDRLSEMVRQAQDNTDLNLELEDEFQNDDHNICVQYFGKANPSSGPTHAGSVSPANQKAGMGTRKNPGKTPSAEIKRTAADPDDQPIRPARCRPDQGAGSGFDTYNEESTESGQHRKEPDSKAVKKSFLRRRDIYDPRKAIEEAKKRQVKPKRREQSQERAANSRCENKKPTISRRGESEARVPGTLKFSIAGGGAKQEQDSSPAENRSPEAVAEDSREEDDKSPKQFLKRRTRRVEPVKLNWHKVGRRIDCWNPKSHDTPSKPKKPTNKPAKVGVGKRSPGGEHQPKKNHTLLEEEWEPTISLQQVVAVPKPRRRENSPEREPEAESRNKYIKKLGDKERKTHKSKSKSKEEVPCPPQRKAHAKAESTPSKKKEATTTTTIKKERLPLEKLKELFAQYHEDGKSESTG